MKKIITIACLLLFAGICFAQEKVYQIDGKQITEISVEKQSVPDMNTGYTYKEPNGQVYDIYITKNNACYILKTSKKTGKEYRKYLEKQLAQKIASELGREIKEE